MTTTSSLTRIPPLTETSMLEFWGPQNPGHRLRAHTDVLFRNIAANYSLAILAPHHSPKNPIDADAISACSAMLKRLQIETDKISRPIQFVRSAKEAKADGPLYYTVLPPKNKLTGHQKTESHHLNLPLLKGKRALLSADAAMSDAAQFVRRNKLDPLGIDCFFLHDHHTWDAETLAKHQLAPIQSCMILNSALFFSENANRYSSGAFLADLLLENSPLIRDLLKQISLVGDHHAIYFPSVVPNKILEHIRSMAIHLTQLGTLIMAADQTIGNRSRMWQNEILAKLIHLMTQDTTHVNLMLALDDFTTKIENKSRITLRSIRTSFRQEVEQSIKAFKYSPERIVFHEVKTSFVSTMAVHKRVYKAVVDELGGFKDRVLVHYHINGYGKLELYLACDPNTSHVDAKKICSQGPGGLDMNGGGHSERAGIDTTGYHDTLSTIFGPHWFPHLFLEHIKDKIWEQLLSRPPEDKSQSGLQLKIA